MRWTALLVLASLSACATADLAGADHVNATINRSEWATANRLSLDLRTGRYSITPGIWTSGSIAGKKRSNRKFGTLNEVELAELRSKAQKAAIAGLHDAECLKIPYAERDWFVISNGGTQEVTLRTGGRTIRARDELECWTDEGTALYDALENAFDPFDGRGPQDSE